MPCLGSVREPSTLGQSLPCKVDSYSPFLRVSAILQSDLQLSLCACLRYCCKDWVPHTGQLPPVDRRGHGRQVMVSVAGLIDKTASDARVVDTESRVGIRSKASLPVPQDNTGSGWLPS